MTGWIAGLVDVSALHAAERQREDALRFLSHDMRSPQASILALVELERPRIDSEPARALLDRIQRYARRALTLADDFVQLERAELQAYALEPASLANLRSTRVTRCGRRLRPNASISIRRSTTPAVWIGADRSLMTRALVNVLNNAIKYSPSDTRITCVVGKDPRFARACALRDPRPGLRDSARAAGSPVRAVPALPRGRPARGQRRGARHGVREDCGDAPRRRGLVEGAPECGTAVTIALPSLDETVGR